MRGMVVTWGGVGAMEGSPLACIARVFPIALCSVSKINEYAGLMRKERES